MSDDDFFDSSFTSGSRFVQLSDRSGNKYSIYADKFDFGKAEIFVRIELEKEPDLRAMTNGQFFKIADVQKPHCW